MDRLDATSKGAQRAESGPLFELWKAADGATGRIDWGRGCVRLAVAGHGHGGFAAPAILRWEEAVRGEGRAVILIDFWDMPTYDSSMRWQMTPWGAKHRNDVEFHVLSRSKPVLIGLSLANIAMSGRLKIDEQPHDFDAITGRHGLPARSTR